MTDTETSPEQLVNYRMAVRYEGQNFYGWQRLKNKPTIQDALEKVVTECFGVRSLIEGSGRTDRGTHALSQVATVRLPDNLDMTKAVALMNQALHSDIEVLSLDRASDDFHARKSAIGKCYSYKIWNHPDLPSEKEGKVWYVPEALDIDLMRKVCPFFIGNLDFASFAKVPNYDRASSTRSVHALHLKAEKPVLTFSIIADGFLYKMVRNIIRAIVKVGEGRYLVEDIPKIIEAKSRQAAPGTAPASGLYLEQVFFNEQEMAAAIESYRQEVI